MPELLQIDLSKLDVEILATEKKLANLKEIRQTIKRLAYPQIINGNHTSSIEENGSIGIKVKLSDFIVNLLGDGKKPTKDIVSAYASKTNSTEKKVYNNVSNALNRLKIEGTIGSEAIGNSRREGYNWYINIVK